MNVLNLYFSTTGNTEKVANRIEETVREQGQRIDTVRITGKDTAVNVLDYDLAFVGSGVYSQLPGQQLIEFYREQSQKYGKQGEIKPCSPRRPSARAVVYCTYGGVHTGMNEAVPSVKYMGQLFDHLGYTVVAEWYIVGEYKTENMRQNSTIGRLGDIRGRPNETDLKEVAERVKGILRAIPTSQT